MSTMKKRIVTIFAAILLLILIWRISVLVLKSFSQSAKKREQIPIAVEIDSVRTEPIYEVRHFTGSVFPIYQYVVAPKVSGRVLVIKKRIGDWVKAGEIVAVIDDAEYQQAVREAEANLKIARASLIEAKSQFALAMQEQERVRLLQEKGIASSAELDAANTNYTAQKSRLELAEAQVEQREAALKSAHIRLGYTILNATQPGYIGERFVDEGALLSPNTPVVSIVGIDQVLVRTTIVERDYGRIQPGQKAEVKVDAFPDRSFQGYVARIAPVLEEASRMAKMEVEVVNTDQLLKPGMFAKITVVLSQNLQAQTIPSKSIVHKDGQSGIFVIDKERAIARFVPIQLGIVGEDKSEVIAPVLHGPVVTLGQHLLADGSPVILPKGDISSSKTTHQ